MSTHKVTRRIALLLIGAIVASIPLSSRASAPTEPKGYSYPTPVYQGVDLSSLPTFNVANFSASGSHAQLSCAGKEGSTLLLCNGSGHFQVGHGIRIGGGGNQSAETGVSNAPTVVAEGNGTSGPHTNCYVVDIVDPLGAISHPSPTTCISNQPALSSEGVWNNLSSTFNIQSSFPGPSPTFIWYVSEDGGPFRFLNAAKFYSNAIDLGQRPGPKRGWPDPLPAANPDISQHEDLFSTVTAVQGNLISIANPLSASLSAALVEHDDTVAIENAILAGCAAGGGTISLGPGTFNVKRPAFTYIVNDSYAYPPFTYDLSLDPWWAQFFYLYVPNGCKGNLDILGSGRTTNVVTPADHGGVAAWLALGIEGRQGDASQPILPIEDLPAGSTQVTLAPSAPASSLAAGDDVYLYSGCYGTCPDLDVAGYPDMHHYSELNTVVSISGNVVTLAYPTTKHYHDDGGSSWGMHKMSPLPHNIEVQHLNIKTSDPLTSAGEVIGLLFNDIQVQGTLSLGAFGGGYKRGVTIENSSWTFGQGTGGWGQLDEYDQFTNLAFLSNAIAGYAAAGVEGASGMAKIYATEGTSQLLFFGNTLNRVSVYTDQSNQAFVQGNNFTDGIVAVGNAYSPTSSPYAILARNDETFVSFASQDIASVDHNSFNFTSDFHPPWVIRLGDYSQGNISDNVISYVGPSAPQWMIGSFNGTVTGNLIVSKVPTAGDMIAIIPDQSPITATSSFVVQSNSTNAEGIHANIEVADPGFTDSSPVCVQNNNVQMTSGVNLIKPSSISSRCVLVP